MQTIAYGSWPSPISSSMLTSSLVGLSSPAITSTACWWLESRPTEAGRSVLVRCDPQGKVEDFCPTGFNVRSRVHEYGGGACLVEDNEAWCCNDADQRVYHLRNGHPPRPLTAENGNQRYADLVLDAPRQRLIAVQELHGGDAEPVNRLVAIQLHGDTGQGARVLASGEDFYSSPCLSADGSKLAWLSWSHPDMPWDHTRLWVADLDADGQPCNTQLIAGAQEESIFQPQWGPAGELYFVSDRNNWWNLYAWTDNAVQPVLEMAAEFGLPQWVFGMSTYAILEDGRIACACSQNGSWQLAWLDPTTPELHRIETGYTEISGLRAIGQQLIFIAGSPGRNTEVVQMDMQRLQGRPLKSAGNVALDTDYLSTPEPIEFPTENGLTAHALYYPPTNPECRAPEGELPPLLVKSHGGPTAATSSALNLAIQYWTSRGFGLLDVNYGGSTGYGREYRERLHGQWGIVDVDDCVNGAKFLAKQGWVDPQRLAIRGSSAGGYTTLAALAFRDTFSAGASHYGISELSSLATDTHKFESRYLDRLIGPWPQARETYRQRSPLHYSGQITAPVIFFQGLEDPVVPPSQAEKMVAALDARRLPVAYVEFAGEQHGFRQADNIRQALDGEWWFYGRIFGFDVPQPPRPVQIRNLPPV